MRRPAARPVRSRGALEGSSGQPPRTRQTRPPSCGRHRHPPGKRAPAWSAGGLSASPWNGPPPSADGPSRRVRRCSAASRSDASPGAPDPGGDARGGHRRWSTVRADRPNHGRHPAWRTGSRIPPKIAWAENFRPAWTRFRSTVTFRASTSFWVPNGRTGRYSACQESASQASPAPKGSLDH